MTIAPGVRLGSYEITGPLGEGGMGVVYRATDSKLKREERSRLAHADLALRPSHGEGEPKVLVRSPHDDAPATS